jgi:hypothetical protein
MKNALLVLCGAAAGGALGYFAFFWFADYGFYGLVLPGGLLGIGAGLPKNRSLVVAVLCGMAALALGLLAEWQLSPFIADASLGYFLQNVAHLNPVTWLMIALGAFIGFWGPYRSIPTQRPQTTRESGGRSG